MNFGDKAISMIKTYLQNRIQKVILPSSSSHWIKLYKGVSQGTILGPLLFNIMLTLKDPLCTDQRSWCSILTILFSIQQVESWNIP